MKKTALVILGIAATFCFGFSFRTIITKQPNNNIDIKQTNNTSKLKNGNNMKLGAFSVSLNVRDINASKQFYENLGFTVFAGGMEKNYLIMKNENSLIGLFQGMFEGNILTFNPGWDENPKNIEKFDDVREIQRQLKSKGIKLITEADEKTSGPAGLMTTDPDGNVILIDQHR
jgi:catechol 2,3-dioxygenase-like lactoylglutathione lyase family enzyme